MAKGWKYGIGLGVVIVLLFVANLLVGSVRIPCGDVLRILLTGAEGAKPSWSFILWESRLPQALTALLAGGALAVSGLLLQTAFKNPLAGPSILGIESGASLGVALVMLLFGGSVTTAAFSLSGFLSVLAGAFIGALVVMALILFFSTLLKSNVMLLITGIMIGYLASSAISLLNFFSTSEGVHAYVVWGMGSFTGVTMRQMPAFAAVTLLGIACSLLLVKPLNALLLGEAYAENLGVNIRRLRNELLVVTGILVAITTAFCGPVAFIGLAMPHVARLLLGTENHRSLLPVTILTGSAVALLCNLICVLPGGWGVIPLNAVTPLIGAPVIIYVIAGRRLTAHT
ncbi:MAG: iron ABC transporter permease [Prevotellaceae bacterium]|nr:iron ABC transporter permease [Prevotellaceae bacterium]